MIAPVLKRLIGSIARRRQPSSSPVAEAKADGQVPVPPRYRTWLIHPDIEAVMHELGIGGFVLPETEDAPILRARVPAGGYWRIEYVPRPGGRLDHAIQRRGDLRSSVQSVTTTDGTMELVVELGELPEILASAIAGRRLGDIVGLPAPAGDAIVEETHRRTMAAGKPTALRTAPREYAIREGRS